MKDLIICVIVVVLVVGITWMSERAQAQAAQQAPNQLQLMQENARLQALVQQLQSKPSPDEYKKTFSDIRADAATACKAAGGKLWAMISYQGSARTVSVSCELLK